MSVAGGIFFLANLIFKSAGSQWQGHGRIRITQRAKSSSYLFGPLAPPQRAADYWLNKRENALSIARCFWYLSDWSRLRNNFAIGHAVPSSTTNRQLIAIKFRPLSRPDLLSRKQWGEYNNALLSFCIFHVNGLERNAYFFYYLLFLTDQLGRLPNILEIRCAICLFVRDITKSFKFQ